MQAGWYECAECGRRFYRESGPGPAPTYCSFECRRAPYERRKRAEHRASVAEQVHVTLCKECGRMFNAARRGRRGRREHRCQACRSAVRTCAWCGKLLTGQQRHYCSSVCYGRHRTAMADSARVPPEPRACEVCGKMFVPPLKGPKAARCSRCRWAAWKERNPRRAAAVKARCRALRRGAQRGQHIDPLAVYERDGWVCGICGKPVDPTRQYPDPMSATLDHIVPIARGGIHSLGNLQVAHLECNSRKHSGGEGQLRLGLEVG